MRRRFAILPGVPATDDARRLGGWRLRRPVLSDLGRSARRPLAAAALAGLVAAGLLLALGAAAGPSPVVPLSRYRDYWDWLAGPLAGVGSPLTPVRFAALLGAMFGCYLVVLAMRDTVRVQWALAAIGAAHLVFLLTAPLLQTDIFAYIAYARLDVVHGLNPYTNGAGAAVGDPVYRLVLFKTMHSPYGPLFTLVSLPFAPLGMEAGLWAVKLVAALTSLGCIGLVWSCARRLDRDPLAPALFAGLNPLLLVWGVGAAHTDLLMALLILAGVYASLRGRERFGAWGVVVAAGVKATAALVLPFAVLGARRRGRTLAGAAAGAAAVVAVSLAAFGVEGLRGYASALLAQQGFVSLISVPTVVSRLLGNEHLTPALHAAAEVGLAVVLAVLLWRAWRGAEWIASAGWAALAVLVTAAFLMPWYILLVLPLAALGDSTRLRYATLALTAYLVVTHAAGLPP